MIYNIKGEFKQVEVLTIYLDSPISKDLKMFFCPNCQNPLFQYNGQVIMLIPGNITEKAPTVVHQCSNRNCRMKYVVQDILQR